MSKPITLSHKQWDRLKYQLAKDYKTSVVMIRSNMKERLGFTTREHVYWTSLGALTGKSRPVSEIHLDFYSDPKRTFFLLKYGEYLNDNVNKD